MLKLKQSISNIALILKNTRKSHGKNYLFLFSKFFPPHFSFFLGDTSLPGADELLPVMILVILYVRPKEIHSEVKFLTLYTRSEKLLSEAGYLLTTFISAVSFIDTVNKDSLTIDPEEFEKNIEICKRNSRKFLENKKQEYEKNIKNKKFYQESNKNNTSSNDILSYFSNDLLDETKKFSLSCNLSYDISSAREKDPDISMTSLLLQEYNKASKDIDKKEYVSLSSIATSYSLYKKSST